MINDSTEVNDSTNVELDENEVYFNGSEIEITDSMNPAMVEQMEVINDIMKTEVIDTTTALHILINVAQITYDSELLNDLDRHLITKAFISIQNCLDAGKDFTILMGNDPTEA
jgi:hypothetical protein